MTMQMEECFTVKTVHLKNGMDIWVESFGDPKNTAILLVSGAGSQCKNWPDEFCNRIAADGYFVIRYDHRDTGKSSPVNYFQTPYTSMDLTKDAIGVLDSFDIQSAHIVGFSMGGQIAQFIGAYFPDYALSITLIATSISFKEGFDAFLGTMSNDGLSQPKQKYITWAIRLTDVTGLSHEEKIRDFLLSKKLLNGEKAPFDEDFWEKIAHDVYTRSELHNPYPNHAMAMKASYKDHAEALPRIDKETLIIHGKEDPVFEIDHAHALHEKIQKSRLVFIDDMGHHLNTRFFDELLSLIKGHIE